MEMVIDSEGVNFASAHCVWNLLALSVCRAPRGDHALLLRL